MDGRDEALLSRVLVWRAAQAPVSSGPAQQDVCTRLAAAGAAFRRVLRPLSTAEIGDLLERLRATA